MAVLCDEFLGFQPLWFSHLDTAKEKKKAGEGANVKLVTNSVFIESSPPNPGFKIKFGHSLG